MGTMQRMIFRNPGKQTTFLLMSTKGKDTHNYIIIHNSYHNFRTTSASMYLPPLICYNIFISFLSFGWGKTICFACIQKFCFLLGVLTFTLALVQFLVPRFVLINDNIFALFHRSWPQKTGFMGASSGFEDVSSIGFRELSLVGLVNGSIICLRSSFILLFCFFSLLFRIFLKVVLMFLGTLIEISLLF